MKHIWHSLSRFLQSLCQSVPSSRTGDQAGVAALDLVEPQARIYALTQAQNGANSADITEILAAAVADPDTAPWSIE
jgi:hypothetical protein